METIYQVVILSLLAFSFFIIVIPNLFYLKRKPPKVELPSNLPKISVLIPARNETKNIGNTLESISRETYPNFEVLVLDDHSEDNTAEIVTGYSEKDSRIQLFKGKDLPEGWAGKNYACQQLSEKASGDFLLFTDSDATFHPGLLEFSLKHAIKNKADLVTAFPRLWSPSFWGKLMVPNVYFLFLGLLPFPLSSNNRFPIIAMGLGIYLFFRKEAYLKIGGHKCVRNVITEDMALAQKVKRADLKLQCLDASLFIESRMYERFSEFWQGYSKSLFKAFGSSYISLISFLVGYSLILIAPFYFLVHYLFIKPDNLLFIIILIQIFLAILCRLVISIRYRQSWQSVALHPFSIGLMIFIGIRSGLLSLNKKGYEWKGRKYS